MSTLTSTQTTDFPGRSTSGLVPAFVVALLLHALVLVGVLFYRLSPPAPPGEQQITVDLSPVSTDAPTQAPAEQQMSQSAPPEAKPIEEPVEEATKPPPPADMAEVKPDEAEAVTPPTQAVIEPPTQVVTSTAEQAEPLAPPPEVAQVLERKPEISRPDLPKPDLAKLKAEREAKLRNIREEQRREEQREEAREERLEAIREAKVKAAREARAKRAKAQEGAETRNSASASRQASAGRAAAGNDPGALNQWKGAISAAIHGRMNPGAAVGTGGGTATVRFTIMRSGLVAGAGLASSSGVGQIDSAALSAVRGSLPAAPPGVTLPSLSVTIPLNYRVR